MDPGSVIGYVIELTFTYKIQVITPYIMPNKCRTASQPRLKLYRAYEKIKTITIMLKTPII